MKVALIGGGSRSGRAFRRFAEAASEIECVSFVRQVEGQSASRSTVTVPDYSEIVPEMLVGFDAVINFVGVAKARKAAELHRINAEIPARVASAAREAKVRHFVYLSSLSIYGPVTLVSGSTPLAPTTDYGRSKVAAEELLQALQSPEFSVSLLRIPTIYGRDSPSKLGTLASMMNRLPWFPVPVPSPPRSIISHENLSRVILHLLVTGESGVKFAADPEPFRLDEFAAALPSPPRLISVPPPLLASVRWLLPSIHASLYEQMEISDALVLRPLRFPLVPTGIALRRAFHGSPPGNC